MFTSPSSRRRLGAVFAGLCVMAGSLGSPALANRNNGSGSGDGSSSGSSTSISVDVNVLVRAGIGPLSARQAAYRLDAAVDAAARTMARSAAAAIPSRTTVRATAAATKAFTTEVDSALTAFVEESVPALSAAGASADGMVTGTLAALAQVVRTLPGAVSLTTGAEIAVAGSGDGGTVSASVNPAVDLAMRQAISGSVRDLRPVVPMSRATVRAVAAGVRQVVDASVVAVDRIVVATVDLAAAVVDATAATLHAARSVARSAVAATIVVVRAVDATLDAASDVNLSAQVDASLRVSAG